MPAMLSRPTTSVQSTPAVVPSRSPSNFARTNPSPRPGVPVGGRPSSGTPVFGRPRARAARAPGRTNEPKSERLKPDAKILFQRFFKSVGPRTYAAQVKEAGNGNHFLVLTEGKRDDKTGEVRKTRLFIFSEDFKEFFGLIDELAKFTRENPVSPDVAAKQQKFWNKKGAA